MTSIWKGTVSSDAKHLSRDSWPGVKEIVRWTPPATVDGVFRPGVLVTYTPGEKYWAGRGNQAYAPAEYTVHVVVEGDRHADGSWRIGWVRHVDVPTNIARAREEHERRSGD